MRGQLPNILPDKRATVWKLQIWVEVRCFQGMDLNVLGDLVDVGIELGL